MRRDPSSGAAPIGPCIADFACYGARLVVELDGSHHAGSARDLTRDAWRRRDGYRLLRVWNNDLTGNADGVLAAIRAALPDSAGVRTMR